MFDYAGSIHFHSRYSYDASQPLERIIPAALKTGLDFALLTDHFNVDAKKEGWERYHEADGKRFLLLVGEEISPRYNHYLAFNLSTPVLVSKTEGHSQDMIDAVNAQGGFGFIAHPDHPGAPLVGARAYPWVDWTVTGFAGLSIWDLMGDLSAALSSPLRIAFAFIWPSAALRGPRPETLQRWDELTQRGRYAAIGEIDNHGTRKWMLGFLPKTVFPFEWAFRTIRTHVTLSHALTGQIESDRPAIFSALREARSYISFDLWNDPRGFQFEALNASQRVGLGGTLKRQGPALVEIKLPSPGRVRLIRNGRVIREEWPRSYMERDADVPGVYRVEVQQKVLGRWRPWIFSNPIWVE